MVSSGFSREQNTVSGDFVEPCEDYQDQESVLLKDHMKRTRGMEGPMLDSQREFENHVSFQPASLSNLSPFRRRMLQKDGIASELGTHSLVRTSSSSSTLVTFIL